MRALIDIEQDRIRELDRLAQKQKRSRAALIREAVDQYLEKGSHAAVEEAFGLWGDRVTDGVAYQDKLRSEW
jgi:predicted transcriptional regulator